MQYSDGDVLPIRVVQKGEYNFVVDLDTINLAGNLLKISTLLHQSSA